MALGPGTRIGVYEVIAPIGEGGIGQVYRARDTTLARGRSRASYGWALVAVVSLAVAAFAIWNRPAAVHKTAVRLTIPLPPGQELRESTR